MKEAENREIATMNLWIFVRDSDFTIVNEILCQWEIMNGSAYTCYLGRIILQVNTVRSIGGSEQDHSSRSDFNKIPENASIQSIYIYMERDRGCKINTYIYRFRIADDIYEAPGGAGKIGHSTQLQTHCEIRYVLIDCGREDPSTYKTFRSLLGQLPCQIKLF